MAYRPVIGNEVLIHKWKQHGEVPAPKDKALWTGIVVGYALHPQKKNRRQYLIKRHLDGFVDVLDSCWLQKCEKNLYFAG